MNDYYLWVCDLESDEKSIDLYWYDDDWLDYSYEPTLEDDQQYDEF